VPFYRRAPAVHRLANIISVLDSKATLRYLPVGEVQVSVADLCRNHGVSDASIYSWMARFGGMEISEAKR
jgi:transposase-like protein